MTITSIHAIKDIEVSFTSKVNETINKKIENFVAAMGRKKQSLSYYTEKRNVKASRAAEDIFLGKKAEYIALVALMREYNFPKVDIDFEIREGSAKGWEEDLAFNKVNSDFPNVHVKSCSKRTVDYCDDYSWTFQKSNNDGRGGTDSVLIEDKEELIVMVYLDNPTSNKGVVKAIMPQPAIKPYLKLPKKVSLWGLKRCVYYKDLLEVEKMSNE